MNLIYAFIGKAKDFKIENWQKIEPVPSGIDKGSNMVTSIKYPIKKKMSTLEEYKELIADLVEEFKEKKIGEIDVDIDTDYEIHKEVEWNTKCILEHLEELDETIDSYIEDMNEYRRAR